ncbi:hypothetical protein STTU_1547 [Streptomyces sp. Tu6071]|nr:hypothetical protein STTU_1547 [Streptomyces sp. Tu6071]
MTAPGRARRVAPGSGGVVTAWYWDGVYAALGPRGVVTAGATTA